MNATSLDKQKKGNNLYVYKFGAGSKTPEYQPPTAAAVTKRIISSSVWGSLRKSKSKPKVKEKEEEGNGNNAKITEKELVKSNGYGNGNGNGNGRRSVSSVEAILLNLASGKTEGRKSVTLSQSVDEGKGKEFPFPFPYPQVHCKGKLEESRKSVSYVESNMGKVGMKKVVMMEKPRKSTGAKLESNVESAVALLQVKVLVTDMPGFMQVHAFQCARNTYDSLEKFSAKHLASNLKKEFDKTYGPAWHCIVGSSFGSFVTHATGCFLYFSMEKLCILLFRTKVQRALKQ